MIISLNVRDFVLIDAAVTSFKPGLNVLTGETGSGKSAVIDALHQILGSKADTDLIRKGQEKAVVEAFFDISTLSHISPLLEDMGISCDGELLHLKREIAREGKGRIWINREGAPLNALKLLGQHLMEFVGQRANKDLFESENHLEILDNIGGLLPLREDFSKAHRALLKKERELQLLIADQEESERRSAKDLEDLNEIESIAPKLEEEEALFEEYTLLSQMDELKGGLQECLEALSNDGILPSLSLIKKKTEEFVKIDRGLQECLDMTVEAIANMKEVERTLDLKLAKLDANPERLAYLENRLKALARLKRLFGPTIKDVIARWETLKKREERSFDELQETLSGEILSLRALREGLGKTLSAKRQAFGAEFSKKVTSILKTLNMPNALFTISWQEKGPTDVGGDTAEFFLSPNLGENPVSVSRSASGGELSRVLLAIKLLEEKNKAPIVFDEIDANIGGNTAVMIGEKMKTLSAKKQVILITHFPQVARFACHHIKISKREREGRTFTEIEPLDENGREEELLRMLGGSCKTTLPEKID